MKSLGKIFILISYLILVLLFQFPMFFDPVENIQKIFGMKSYPTTVVLEKQRKFLATLVGYNEENTKQLKKLLEK